MRTKDLKKFCLRRHYTSKDSEGNVVDCYEKGIQDKAIIWPAGGRIQSQIYGIRVNSILNMNYYGSHEIHENDGICIDNGIDDLPDYRVVSVRKYSKFTKIEIEKRVS